MRVTRTVLIGYTSHTLALPKDLVYRLISQPEDFRIRTKYQGARGTGRRRWRRYDRDLDRGRHLP